LKRSGLDRDFGAGWMGEHREYATNPNMDCLPRLMRAILIDGYLIAGLAAGAGLSHAGATEFDEF